MKIVMLVRNNGSHDTRVWKEASFLQDCGHEVIVLAKQDDTCPEDGYIREVFYKRVAVTPITVRRARDKLQMRQEKLRKRRARAVRRIRRRISSQLSKDDTGARALRPEAVEWRGLLRRVTIRIYEELTRLYFYARLRLNWYRFKSIQFTYRKILIGVFCHTDYQKSVGQTLVDLHPDVVHAHDLNTAYAALRLKALKGTPFVYDAHEFELGRSGLDRSKLRTLADYWFERRVIRSAAATITVSEGIAQALAKIYRVRRPEVVLNSPSITALRVTPQLSLRRHLRLEDTDRMIVFVGIVTINRGLEQVVECLRHLPLNYHVVLLGPRRGEIASDLETRAREASAENRLHMVDPVPPEEISATIREADAFIFAVQNACKSFDLAMPNKLFDALFADLPIAVGGLGAMNAFVSTHQLGVVVDETDPASMALSLQELIANPRRPSPEKLLELQTQVCWESQTKRIEAIYTRLAMKNRQPVEPCESRGVAAE